MIGRRPVLSAEFTYNSADKEFTIQTTRYDMLRSNFTLIARNPWMVGFVAILVILFDILPILSKPIGPSSFFHWLSEYIRFAKFQPGSVTGKFFWKPRISSSND